MISYSYANFGGWTVMEVTPIYDSNLTFKDHMAQKK